jgi:hypothetical protein
VVAHADDLPNLHLFVALADNAHQGIVPLPPKIGVARALRRFANARGQLCAKSEDQRQGSTRCLFRLGKMTRGAARRAPP